MTPPIFVFCLALLFFPASTLSRAAREIPQSTYVKRGPILDPLGYPAVFTLGGPAKILAAISTASANSYT